MQLLTPYSITLLSRVVGPILLESLLPQERRDWPR